MSDSADEALSAPSSDVDSPNSAEGDAAELAPGQYERGPDGNLRWPAPDRDSPQLGSFQGHFEPDPKFGALLQMDGFNGRSEEEVERVTGLTFKRPRRPIKLLERMGIFYPGEGLTKLTRLGRLLRDAAQADGMKRIVAQEAVGILNRYQFNNPVERALPDGCDIHPYWAVLRAASQLDWKIHWDEVNRELMRMTTDAEIDDVVARIGAARRDPGYDAFIGKESNEAGLLRARIRPAEPTTAEKHSPESQLRDQKMTPFLKRAGFGELLLASPGRGGGGYWTVPEEFRNLVARAVTDPPEVKCFATEGEWIQWFCEGVSPAAQSALLEAAPIIVRADAPPPKPSIPVRNLTFSQLRTALDTYAPDLVFSDELLASVVAALRAGDGKMFIILRGVSGTGKSQLVAAIARAVYGMATVEEPYLTMVEVKPDWTDNSGLLGHFDPVGNKYVVVKFLDAMIAASTCVANEGENGLPVFVCLDEMNLAKVEYYLADCLSAMESGNRIALDTRGASSCPSSIAWPHNLYLFGTVNVDETTLAISDKVLDRAQVIDTSDIDLLPQLDKWLAATEHMDDADRARVREIVGGAWTVLQEAEAHFGFRTAKAIVRFVDEAKASSDGKLSVDAALDAQIIQKVLPKLRGEGDRWAAPLDRLVDMFDKLKGKRRAHSITVRMRNDVERLGSFQFWN